MILQDFSPPAVARAIELNSIEGVKLWSNWPGIEVREERDLIWTLTSIPFPIFNNVLGARLAPEDVESGIEAVLARVKERNVPMAWWLGPTTEPADLGRHLEARGFTHVEDPPGMAVDLLALSGETQTPPGLTIEEVLDQGTLAESCQLFGALFEFPDFAAEAWSSMISSMALGTQSPLRHFLARLEGRPVATSSLFFGAGVAGISSVGTLPAVRRQGIGTTITLRPLQEARRAGYRIGTLFSSQMGEKMYLRMGFKEYCRGGIYIWKND
jgi:GNAT superfamily N-acetyltransferase